MDDFYKTCRWCRWNKNGECQHSGTFAVDSLKAECRLDDGIIYEAVKEAFSDKTFATLKRNLESELSKKKANLFYQEFLQELEDMQRECNEWLDDADRNIFLRMKENNPRRYRIEGAGDWGIADGLIYTNVIVKDFDVDQIRAIPGIKSAFGLDFGFTDPNAFTACMVDNTAMKIYVFDEWYKTGVTNKIIAEQIKRMGYGGQRLICDSAEPKSIAELQDEGLRAESSRKGKDSVNHGIQLIQNYQIMVHPRCVEFKKEIDNYCWAKGTDGKPTDKPDHEFSHGMDSMRYAVTKVLMPDTFSFD